MPRYYPILLAQDNLFKHALKTTMQMDVLHGQTVPGVLKELTIFAIIYTLIRLVMRQSAALQHTAVERISFLDTLRWLGAPGTGTPLGALRVNPVRPHRLEPRVKKRRLKSFPFMITPRQTRRQQLIQPGLRGALHAVRPRAQIILQSHRRDTVDALGALAADAVIGG